MSSNPECPAAANQLAVCLDELFRLRLPRAHYTGILEGREDDVRQEAYLLLVGKYLAGNPALLAATAAGDRRLIAEEIHRSLGSSIRSVSKTLKKQLLRHQQMHTYGEDPDTHAGHTCIHPACRVHLWELPFEMQRQIVFASLRIGVQENLIYARSAQLAMDMLDQGLSQSQIARSLGVSRQAVHAMLAPVRKHLAEIVATQEFPLA